MAFILYILGKIEEAMLYYDKSLKINPNLTEVLTEKELIVFNKLMNYITKREQRLDVTVNKFIPICHHLFTTCVS